MDRYVNIVGEQFILLIYPSFSQFSQKYSAQKDFSLIFSNEIFDDILQETFTITGINPLSITIPTNRTYLNKKNREVRFQLPHSGDITVSYLVRCISNVERLDLSTFFKWRPYYELLRQNNSYYLHAWAELTNNTSCGFHADKIQLRSPAVDENQCWADVVSSSNLIFEIDQKMELSPNSTIRVAFPTQIQSTIQSKSFFHFDFDQFSQQHFSSPMMNIIEIKSKNGDIPTGMALIKSGFDICGQVQIPFIPHGCSENVILKSSDCMFLVKQTRNICIGTMSVMLTFYNDHSMDDSKFSYSETYTGQHQLKYSAFTTDLIKINHNGFELSGVAKAKTNVSVNYTVTQLKVV